MNCLIQRNSMPSLHLILATLMSLTVFVCFAQPVAPQVSVDLMVLDGVEHIKLSWEAIEGAESYNIYASTDPYLEDWGEPLATIGEGVTEYITESVDDLGRAYYFYVTSYAESGIPDWFVLVDGDQFNGNVAIDPFYISKYEVTQADFVDVMGEWNFHFGRNPTHPAEMVRWFDAVEYCNRLSISEGLQPVYTYNGRSDPDLWHEQWPGWNEDNNNHSNVSCDWEANGYRMPTEAEWHHAANGSRHMPESEWPFGSPYQYAGSNNIDEVAWYNGNADNQTHPVGTKLPNSLGIYDMSGNIYEWCWDIYGGDFPSGGDNPHGPDGGGFSIMRGGSSYGDETYCAVSLRGIYIGSSRLFHIGFRICRIIP